MVTTTPIKFSDWSGLPDFNILKEKSNEVEKINIDNFQET